MLKGNGFYIYVENEEISQNSAIARCAMSFEEICDLIFEFQNFKIAFKWEIERKALIEIEGKAAIYAACGIWAFIQEVEKMAAQSCLKIKVHGKARRKQVEETLSRYETNTNIKVY